MKNPKLLTVREIVALVPNTDGPWVRWRINEGRIRTAARTGYHVYVLASELAKIERMAAARRKKA